MDKKYELTNEKIEVNGKTLYRIQAIKNFGDVKKDDLGGYVEKECNLSHDGDSWIYDDALVFNNACISDNAEIRNIAKVFGDALVGGDAQVFGRSEISGDAWLYGNVQVSGDAEIKSRSDIVTIDGLGSKSRTTSIFKTKEGIEIICNDLDICFYCPISLDLFRKEVKKLYGDTQYATEYLMFADLAELRLKGDK